MPILGVIASSWRSAFTPTGSYDALATYTVPSGGVSSITFAGLPTGGQYTHLQLRTLARTDANNTESYLQLQFNGDTGSNYYGQHWLAGSGSSATAGADGTASVIYVERMTAANTGASIFGAAVIDVLDYANISKNKTTRHLGAFDGNGTGVLKFASGLWLSTSAINSIKITPPAGNFVQYSSFSLYGVKG